MNSSLRRAKLSRKFIYLDNPYDCGDTTSKVQVKISSFKTGEVVSVKPEFDDCKEIAVATGTPLQTISLDMTTRALQALSDPKKDK